MFSDTLPDHYKILELPNTTRSTTEEIRSSYKRLALAKHPDKNGSTEAATKTFQKLVGAYEVLSDERLRRQYDVKYNSRNHASQSTSQGYTPQYQGTPTPGFTHRSWTSNPTAHSHACPFHSTPRST